MAEAEKTMTRPTTTRRSVVKKIHLSTPTRLAIVSCSSECFVSHVPKRRGHGAPGHFSEPECVVSHVSESRHGAPSFMFVLGTMVSRVGCGDLGGAGIGDQSGQVGAGPNLLIVIPSGA